MVRVDLNEEQYRAFLVQFVDHVIRHPEECEGLLVHHDKSTLRCNNMYLHREDGVYWINIEDNP